MSVFGLLKHHYPISIRHNKKDYMWFFTSYRDANYVSNILKRDSIINLEIKNKEFNLPDSFLMKDPLYHKNKTFKLYPYVDIHIQKSNSSITDFIDVDELEYDTFLTYPVFRTPTILVSNIITDTNDEIVLNSTISESIIPDDNSSHDNDPPAANQVFDFS